MHSIYERVLISVLLPCTVLLSFAMAMAAPIDLPKDTDGWTIFTPSADSRIVYISSDGDDASGVTYAPSDAAIGSDPFNPTGPIQAFETYAEAYAQTRDDHPDWILIERGGEFLFSFGFNIRSGRAADEPFLIGAYGASGAMPLVKTGDNSGFDASDLQYFAIFGIDFYAHTRDPDGPEYVDGSGASGFRLVAGTDDSLSGLLFEGCKFRFYRNNIIQKYHGDMAGDIDIRRCIFTDNYSESSHSQGLYTNLVDGLVLEENIFIHNGWYTQQVGGGNDQDGGQATMFNHNTYFSNATNVTFSKNIFMVPSSIGTKWTSNDGFRAENIVLDNNLFVDGEIAIGLGGNTTEALRFVKPVVRNNVITNIGRSQPTGRTLGWGIGIQDWDCGLVANNLLINQPLDVITNTYGFSVTGTLQDVTITGNTVHNVRFAEGLYINASRGSDVSDMEFSDNKIQIDPDGGYTIDAGYDTNGKWDFIDNIYYNDREADSQFRLEGDRISWAQWQSATGDTSSFETHAFSDPTRNIEGYQGSIGATNTIDAFISACRDQGRFSWDPRYTAEQVNAWIKAGFDLVDTDAEASGCTEATTPTPDEGGDGGSSGCFVLSSGT